MIYDTVIKQYNESKFDLPTQLEILQEYYENEIFLLNSTIRYQNSIIDKDIITESEIEYLHEEFVETVKDKIKELIKKFIEFCKNLINWLKQKILEGKRLLILKKEKLKTKLKNVKTAIKESEEESITCKFIASDFVKDFENHFSSFMDIITKSSDNLKNSRDLQKVKDMLNLAAREKLDDDIKKDFRDTVDRLYQSVDDSVNEINKFTIEDTPDIKNYLRFDHIKPYEADRAIKEFDNCIRNSDRLMKTIINNLNNMQNELKNSNERLLKSNLESMKPLLEHTVLKLNNAVISKTKMLSTAYSKSLNQYIQFYNNSIDHIISQL